MEHGWVVAVPSTTTSSLRPIRHGVAAIRALPVSLASAFYPLESEQGIEWKPGREACGGGKRSKEAGRSQKGGRASADERPFPPAHRPTLCSPLVSPLHALHWPHGWGVIPFRCRGVRERERERQTRRGRSMGVKAEVEGRGGGSFTGGRQGGLSGPNCPSPDWGSGRSEGGGVNQWECSPPLLGNHSSRNNAGGGEGVSPLSLSVSPSAVEPYNPRKRRPGVHDEINPHPPLPPPRCGLIIPSPFPCSPPQPAPLPFGSCCTPPPLFPTPQRFWRSQRESNPRPRVPPLGGRRIARLYPPKSHSRGVVARGERGGGGRSAISEKWRACAEGEKSPQRVNIT